MFKYLTISVNAMLKKQHEQCSSDGCRYFDMARVTIMIRRISYSVMVAVSSRTASEAWVTKEIIIVHNIKFKKIIGTNINANLKHYLQ